MTAAGVRPVPLDVSSGDFSSLPTTSPTCSTPRWPTAPATGVHAPDERAHLGSAALALPGAKGFVYCSTGSIYEYQGQRPLRESDPPGVPLRGNYSFSKVAGEAVCTWIAEHFGVPLTILRICSTYGPRRCALRPARADDQGRPITLHPDKPNNYNPIYEDDYVAFGIRAMEVARVPPLVVNWAGSETVSAEDYCAYMGELVGVEPQVRVLAEAHTPLWPDVTLMHEVFGPTRVHWRDGFRRMIEARYPDLVLSDEHE